GMAWPQIDEEGAAARRGRKVLGVEKILAQDPCKPLATGTGKKSPAPMLFFSSGRVIVASREVAAEGIRLASALLLLTATTLAMVAGGTPPGAWAQGPPLVPARSSESIPTSRSIPRATCPKAVSLPYRH
ncbi:MAG: hypothetical protein GY856_16180, partial [bacterium]|nr:hypothetical protein [bacterium]